MIGPGRTSATCTVRSSSVSGRVRFSICICARDSIWKTPVVSASWISRVDLPVVVRDPGQVDPLAAHARDLVDAALDRRQHPQPEQVDLEEAGVAARVLVPLHHLAALHRRPAAPGRGRSAAGSRSPSRPGAGTCAAAAPRRRAPASRARPSAASRRAAPRPRCRCGPSTGPPGAPAARSRRAAGRAPSRSRAPPSAPGRSRRRPRARSGRGRSGRARAGSAPRGCRAGSRGRCRAAR